MNGLLVEDVEDGSPAAEAGLRSGTLNVTVEGVPWVLGGDVLVALHGTPIRTTEAFVEAIKTLRVGQEVQIALLRNGEHLNKWVVLGERRSGSLRPKGPSSQQMAGAVSRSLPSMAGVGLMTF